MTAIATGGVISVSALTGHPLLLRIMLVGEVPAMAGSFLPFFCQPFLFANPENSKFLEVI